jgi:hypothetical protein
VNTEQAIIKFENIIKMADEIGVEPPPEIEAALAALRAQQERENPKPLTLEEVAELAKAKRRADKAVEDLNALRKKSGWKCFACKYDTNYVREVCAGCDYNNGNNWQWRGDAEEDAERAAKQKAL